MIHVSVIPWELAEEELGERLDVAVDKIGIKMCWEAGGANTSMATRRPLCGSGHAKPEEQSWPEAML